MHQQQGNIRAGVPTRYKEAATSSTRRLYSGRSAPLFWLLIAVLATAPGTSFAKDRVSSELREEITIIGSREAQNRVTGSAHYLDEEQFKLLGHSDIQRIIRQIPGVSVQVEDGYGLRPNISIRGVATERSGRITLLEDNVLIAPAPYSAPSAYYFPTIGRIAALEVLKGPAAITQGPYTLGGALNMISTPVPDLAAGQVVAEAGQDATYRLHAYYGASNQAGLGFLVEAHRWRSDGFQELDSGGNTGLNLVDYMIKLRYAPLESRHRLELKWQYADQASHQSYLGLTDAHFRQDAVRRYGLSALDRIDTRHHQLIVRYELDLTDNAALTLVGYDNRYQRSWFKTEGIDLDGSSDAQSFSRTSWFNVIQAINRRESLGDFSSEELTRILDGSMDTPAGSIQLRSNDREYFSRGLQLGLDWRFIGGLVAHEMELAVRFHQDEEDRLQRNSTYSQLAGVLNLDDPGLLGNAGNRVQEARAWSIHAYDRIEFGNWVLTPGIRYEDIDQQRTRWEIRPARTSDPASRDLDNIRDTRENRTRVWLPGLGVIYQLAQQLSLFGGVHKGFTAPSNAPGVKEEEAINYELGLRFFGDNTSLETAFFLSDYNNLLGECTASSGSGCQIGDAFNGEAATVWGLEVTASREFQTGKLSVPLELVYTYIDAEFDTDIADTDFFGDVSKGDPIPYIPRHQANLLLSVQGANWKLGAGIHYVDEVCVRAACGSFERTDSALTIDLVGDYQINDYTRFFARIENITGEEDILGRHPYGARPNKATTASLGVRFTF